MTIVGAHVSTSGGIHKAFLNAENIGADAIQIFGASPRQWAAKLPDSDSLEKFHQAKEESKVQKIFLHASYLVNLGTPDDDLYRKSIKNLETHLKIANELGAEGLIYHIGSYKGSTAQESYQRIADGMAKVIEAAAGNAKLLMENAAGGGQRIGITPEEIGEIYKLNPHPRIGVCIDTCHAFAAGLLETFSEAELNSLAARIDDSFGLENLLVLHVNDSKTAFNSAKDRHENLGEGHIGLNAFKNLANHPKFKNIPWLLEVPGFDGKGPDEKNIEIAKSCF